MDLPAFPLQLLVRRHPDWRDAPAVVVDKDRPQGIICWSNERARAFRILPGMRYAAALSLARDLRADVIEPGRIDAHVAALVETLQRFSPNVEPREGDPGVFWLDASGLERLYPSLETWARGIADALGAEGFAARVVVAFTRMGSYAIARDRGTDTHERARRPTRASRDGSAHETVDDRTSLRVFANPREERHAASRVALARLGIEPRTRDALSRLGVTTLGQFLRLPRAGVKRRFGVAAFELHRQATGDLQLPLTAAPHVAPMREEILLDYPEEDLARIVLVIETLLDELVTRLVARNASLSSVTIMLGFELGRERRTESLRPASPTRDRKQILQLVALRLGASFARTPPTSGVVEIALEAEGVSSEREQLDLFAETPRRDRAAAARALARLRAELGEGSVLYATPREGHLPEARVSWAPMQTIAEPSPANVRVRPLVRRLFDRPVPLPGRPRHEPDGWLVAGFGAGAVRQVCGPYVISGGWWMRRVERRYHLLETSDRRRLWVYEDAERRRWFRHGTVE